MSKNEAQPGCMSSNPIHVRIFMTCLLSVLLLTGCAATDKDTDLPVVLKGGTVIDVAAEGNSASDIHDSIVLIEEGKITTVGPQKEVAVPPRCRVYNVKGRYIVPGLTDAFATLPNESFARAFLYMGVTSVVCVSIPGSVREKIYDRASPGPRIYPARRANGMDASGTILRSRALSAQVDALRLNGAKIVLLYYNHTPDQTATIVRRAKELGLGTMAELGHTPYSFAVKTGVDALLHTTRYSAELMPLDLKRKSDDNPFGPRLSRKRKKFLTQLNLNQNPSLSRLSALYASGKTALIPTLSLYYIYLPGHENPWKEKVSSLIDREDMENPVDISTGLSDDISDLPFLPEFAGKIVEIEAFYRKAGVKTYLAGSGTPINNTLPGISLHTELKLLVRIGMNPRQAIAAATSNFGSVFPFKNTGLVSKGYNADLLVLNSDPLQNIQNLKDIHMVILNGKIIDRKKLLAK